MSQVFDTLRRRYRELVAQSLTEEVDESFRERVGAFLADARRAGEAVANPGERGQLRSYMRHLAALLQEAGGEVPEIDLLPLDRDRWPVHPSLPRPTRELPAWFWGVVGAAALVVAAALVAVAVLTLRGASLSAPPIPTPPPTSTALPTPVPTRTPTSTSTPTPTPTPTATATPQPEPPTFSGLTLALGMLSPTEPFLTGNEFDWNTQAVYAVFDYAGAREGLAWSVVWLWNGEEVAREQHLWDVEGYGRSGTRWVVLFGPDGDALRSGEYTVTLYIEEELQDEAAFRIRYYIPPATPTPFP